VQIDPRALHGPEILPAGLNDALQNRCGGLPDIMPGRLPDSHNGD
jgi:hypothetical protein